MNDEEIRSTLEQIKAQVKAKPENKDKSEDEIDEMILDAFFKAFTEGELSKDDLENLAGAMGYEFTEEFAADETVPTPAAGEGEGEESPKEPEGEPAEGEGVTQEELEDARTIEPGETVEDFKEKIEDVQDGKAEDGAGEEEDGEEVEEEEDDEETQRSKASKLFGMDLNKK